MSDMEFGVSLVALVLLSAGLGGLLVWYVGREAEPAEEPEGPAFQPAVVVVVPAPPCGDLTEAVEQILAEVLEANDVGWITAARLAEECRQALDGEGVTGPWYAAQLPPAEVTASARDWTAVDHQLDQMAAEMRRRGEL